MGDYFHFLLDNDKNYMQQLLYKVYKI